MAQVNYAQKRQEKVWVRSQTAMQVPAVPTARDAVKLRGGQEIPSVLSDFVPSEELRDTPDTDQFLKRKKPPGEFTLTAYAKVPSTKGRLPQWGALMKDTFGIEQLVLTVLNFGNLLTKTVTVVVDGTSTVLTEPTQWAAVTSNSVTATNLASAINALAGVSATAVGAEVLVTRDAGTGEFSVTSNAPLTDLSLGEVRYKLDTDILEKAFTLWHGTHNATHIYRDCKVSSVQINASGGDEATLVFSGMLGNEVYAGTDKLEGTIDGTGVAEDVRAFALEKSVLQIGPLAADTVFIKIGPGPAGPYEIFEVITWNPDTKAGTAKRGKFGSTIAAHADAEEVLPYEPGADPDANDTIIPLTLGVFQLDGVAYRVVSIEAMKDERLNGRLDEAFEAALTGYRRPLEGRTVEGTIVAYQQLTILELQTYGEREKAAVCLTRLGSASGPRIEVNMPIFRIGKVEKGETAGEFTKTLPFQGLATGTPGNDGINIVVKQ